MAMAIAGTLALAFVAGQSTTISASRNLTNAATARGVAETGLRLAAAHVRAEESWRDDRTNGVWVAEGTFAGGTYQIVGEDGRDDDGDGVISVPAEGDGDLADDGNDLVTLTVTGRYGGATHIARAVVTPIPGAKTALLFIVSDPDNLTATEAARKALFAGWGYDVETLATGAAQSEYDQAMSAADVAYISAEVSSTAATRLQSAGIGVVTELGAAYTPLGLSTGYASSTGTTLDVVDADHYVTSVFGEGELVIAATSVALVAAQGTIAADASALGESVGGDAVLLATVEAGTLLADATPAAGRRVMLPWGTAGFDPATLTDDGRMLLKRSLAWSAQPIPTPDAVVHYDFEEQSGAVVNDRAGDLNLAMQPGNGALTWTQDVQCGGGVLFDQNAQSGTAVIRTVTDSAADALKGALQATQAFTVQVFLNAANFDNSGGRLVTYSWGTNTNDRNLTLLADNDGGDAVDLEGRVRYASGVSGHRSSDVFALNEPHVLAYTVDLSRGSNNVKLYVDGVEQQSWSRTGNFDAWVSARFMLGNEHTLDRPFRGTMYDVKVWDQPLSAAQLLRNAQQMLPADDESPQLVALYTFNEVLPTTELIGHWALDEAGGGGGSPGMALTHSVGFGGGNAVIDTYRSSLGPYGPGNMGENAIVTLNSTSWGAFSMWSGSTLKGDAYIGPGGNINTVFSVWGATITGERGVLDEAVAMPSLSAPTGPPFDGPAENVNAWGNMVVTVTEDRHFSGVGLWGNSRMIIDGNVTLLIEGQLGFGNNNSIELTPGSSLDLYIRGGISIGGTINASLKDPGACRIYMLGNGQALNLYGVAEVYAQVFNPLGTLDVWSRRQFYGTFMGKALNGDGGVHIDLDHAGGGGSGPSAALDQKAGNDGSYTGASAGADGVSATAAEFDGSDDYIEIPHAAAYLVDDGAVSLWFKTDQANATQGLFSKDSQGYDTGGHLHLFTEGSRVKARLQSTGASYTLQSGTIQNNTWYHAVVTFGANGFKLYLNGQLVGSNPYAGGLGTSSGGTGNHEPIVLGANAWNSGNLVATPLEHFFSGFIDDVRFYQGALSAIQVDRLFQGLDVGDAQGPGYLVQDTSGYGVPLDLMIGDPSEITWIDGGGLTFDAPTQALSSGPAGKLHTTLTETDEMTLEVVFTPKDLLQAGPARIATYSANLGERNFTLAQAQDQYVQRLRTSTTGANGTPDIASGSVLTPDVRQHVVMTFGDDKVKIYRNGALEVSADRPGTLLWNNAYPFALAGEPTGDAPWLGTLHRVAIYDRALAASQVDDIFDGRPPGDAATGGYTYELTWGRAVGF